MKDTDRQTNYLQIYSEEFQNSRKNLLLCAVCYRPELDQTACRNYFLSHFDIDSHTSCSRNS